MPPNSRGWVPTCSHMQDEQSQPLFPQLGDPAIGNASTGDCPETSAHDVQALLGQIASLKLENTRLHQQNADLNAELNNIRVSQESEDPEVPLPEDPEAPSEEALRKRLERMCKRRTDGNLS